MDVVTELLTRPGTLKAPEQRGSQVYFGRGPSPGGTLRCAAGRPGPLTAGGTSAPPDTRGEHFGVGKRRRAAGTA